MTLRFTRLLAFTFSALLSVGMGAAVWANPDGPNVVVGSVTITGEGANHLHVDQQSTRAIIDWTSFDIAPGEVTQFSQPSTDAVALNRVTGGLGPSEIAGLLLADGQVFLVNPDGILISATGVIDTAGFLATTSDIANADFLEGKYLFIPNGAGNASVVNLGTITVTDGGFAALVAPGVRNAGTISARLGQIGLASAEGFTLDFYGDGLITLIVDAETAGAVRDVATGETLGSLVLNEGTLSADGGIVQVTAAAARQVVNSVVNNTGVIEANTVGLQNGRIFLGASTGTPDTPEQTVSVSGTLSTGGQNSGETGGTIHVIGETIEVTAATIDASGSAGGGEVLIGGDVFGGAGSGAVSLPVERAEPVFSNNATTVTLDENSIITVSSTEEGNGGLIVLWSDGDTTALGEIQASGGSEGGNGGFIEVSGYERLYFDADVDLSSLEGHSGTLLLDPRNVFISEMGDWVVTPASILAALEHSNVVVTTHAEGDEDGDILVVQDLHGTFDNNLKLAAHRHIVFGNGVIWSNAGSGNLELRADSEGVGAGTIAFGQNALIDWSQGTGSVEILYNSTSGYGNPADYGSRVLVNPWWVSPGTAIPGQFNAYMLVNDISDLQNISQNLNGTYALGRDIDASETPFWEFDTGQGFAPIGSALMPFNGLLNGRGHTIDELMIAHWVRLPSEYEGLFGYIGEYGVVSNLRITNATLYGYSEVFGVISGQNNGHIEDVHVSGFIGVGPTFASAGGVVGHNYGVISRSSSNVEVSGGLWGYGLSLGGLAGRNFGEIFWSSSSGTVHGQGEIGGLVGGNYGGTIADSHSSSDVYARSSGGGLVGYHGPLYIYEEPGDDFDDFEGELEILEIIMGLITRSYATGTLRFPSTPDGFGSVNLGGLVGSNNSLIEQSFATGDMYAGGLTAIWGTIPNGGLVAANSGTISQSYATGSVFSGHGIYSPSGAGLVGRNYPGTGSGLITQSYSIGLIDGVYTAGLILVPGSIPVTFSYWDIQSSNQPESGAGIGLTTAQLTSGLPAGFDSNVWGHDSNYNNGYPYLLWERAVPPDGPSTLPTVVLVGGGIVVPPVEPLPVDPPPVEPPPMEPPPVDPPPVDQPSVDTEGLDLISFLPDLNEPAASPSYLPVNFNDASVPSFIPQELVREVLTYALISKDVYEDERDPSVEFPPGVRRTGDWESLMRLAGVDEGQIGTWRRAGFYAALYRDDNTGEIILAFRGSDQFVRDILVGSIPARIGVHPLQYQAAMRLAVVITALYGRVPNLTGHSLGGALASYVAANFSDGGAFVPGRVVTFEADRNSLSLDSSHGNQINLVVPGSFVGDPVVGQFTSTQTDRWLSGDTYQVPTSEEWGSIFSALSNRHSMSGIIDGLRGMLR